MERLLVSNLGRVPGDCDCDCVPLYPVEIESECTPPVPLLDPGDCFTGLGNARFHDKLAW